MPGTQQSSAVAKLILLSDRPALHTICMMCHSRDLVLQALNIVIKASGPFVVCIINLRLHESRSLQRTAAVPRRAPTFASCFCSPTRPPYAQNGTAVDGVCAWHADCLQIGNISKHSCLPFDCSSLHCGNCTVTPNVLDRNSSQTTRLLAPAPERHSFLGGNGCAGWQLVRLC
jgi:hypothetical protein